MLRCRHVEDTANKSAAGFLLFLIELSLVGLQVLAVVDGNMLMSSLASKHNRISYGDRQSFRLESLAALDEFVGFVEPVCSLVACIGGAEAGHQPGKDQGAFEDFF